MESSVSTGVGYTRAGVATRIGISLRMVDKLLASGQLPHYRIGRKVLVSEEHVQRYLSDAERAPVVPVRRRRKRAA